MIEISVNGSAFAPITPVGGYPKTFRYLRGGGNPATGPMPGRPCYGGIIPWTAREIDLSAYAEQTVQVRFRFGTDSGTGREGWYVDDIQVRGQLPGPPPPPDPVIDVVIHAAGDDVLLNWSPSTSGADYYVIYRSTDSEFLAEPADSIGWTAGTTFTDPAIVPATTQNYYIIKAVRN